jgi:ABC-type transporter Mla MlaB component
VRSPLRVTSEDARPLVLVCDVGALANADEDTLNALAAIQLAARRAGASIRFVNANDRLRDLLELVGLADVLPCSGALPCSGVLPSDVQMGRDAEEREQRGVDEVVDPGDSAV